MTDLIRETNEAMRDEKTMLFFRRWMPWLVVLIIIIVTFVGFYQYYSKKNIESIALEASKYSKLTNIQLSKLDDVSIDILNSLLSGNSGYSLAAHFRLADYYLNLKNYDKAIILYQEINEGSWDKIYTSYAMLQLLNIDYLKMKNSISFQKQLNQYIVDTGSNQNFWHSQAMYLGAGAALDSGDKKNAISWLERLNFLNLVPDLLRKHSVILLQDIK